MAKTFHLTIARIGENLFDGEAVSVTLPGDEWRLYRDGESRSIRISARRRRSKDRETPDGEHRNISISAGGIAEISGNQATIIL